MQTVETYKLPASGEARERLREKGQFWTPDWVAEAMVAYVLADRGNMAFDPAVGAGAFFRAAKKVAGEKGLYVTLSGMDIDSTALDQAIEFGLMPDEVAGVKIGDFVFEPPQANLPAIVANPPYIRHHRLSASLK
jgi:type I restriction-modification system DNA methylase subunit